MENYSILLDIMKSKGAVAVAFSGGVDSSLAALAAKDALGDRSLAVIVNSAFLPSNDMESARTTAREIGIRLLEIEMYLMDRREITANPRNRCGLCKGIIMEEIIKKAEEEGFGVVADGTLIEDEGDYRPGIETSNRLGIWHPLMEARISKYEARRILKSRSISIHDRPSTTCLATRVPYGDSITKEKLDLIDRIEQRISSFGFKEVRLRLFTATTGEELGIIEVEDPVRLSEDWSMIREKLPPMRFSIDPLGYRQGSMNKIA
ncbi:MAG: ATP-dependent sacrificial sulfur transferase LarE [Thermoplasmatota archaeon]